MDVQEEPVAPPVSALPADADRVTSTTVTAAAPCARRPSHPRPPLRHRRPHARHGAGVDGEDHHQHRHADDHRRPARAGALRLGRVDLPARLHGHACRSTAGWPTRWAASASSSAAIVLFCVGSVLAAYAAVHDPAHPLPRPPGPGRRRRHAGRAHHPRRHLHARRARPHPGLLQRRLGRRRPRRAGAGRVPRQHASAGGPSSSSTSRSALLGLAVLALEVPRPARSPTRPTSTCPASRRSRSPARRCSRSSRGSGPAAGPTPLVAALRVARGRRDRRSSSGTSAAPPIPILPPELLMPPRHRPVDPRQPAASASAFLSLDTYVPLYVQGGRGGGATAAARRRHAGHAHLGRSAASFAAPLLVRWGFRKTALLGSALIVVGFTGLLVVRAARRAALGPHRRPRRHRLRLRPRVDVVTCWPRRKPSPGSSAASSPAPSTSSARSAARSASACSARCSTPSPTPTWPASPAQGVTPAKLLDPHTTRHPPRRRRASQPST